jgi:hypothetical protein
MTNSANETESTGREDKNILVKHGILHGSFGVIAGAIFGSLITVFGTWLLTKNLHLTYSDGQVVIFKGDKNKFGIATCQVENDGDKEVTDLTCEIKTPNAKVTEVKVVPDSIKHEAIATVDKIVIKVDYLNQGEKLTVSVLMDNAGDVGEHLEVTARGKGITGTKQRKEKIWSWNLVAIVIVSNLVVHWIYRFARYQVRQEMKEQEKS